MDLGYAICSIREGRQGFQTEGLASNTIQCYIIYIYSIAHTALADILPSATGVALALMLLLYYELKETTQTHSVHTNTPTHKHITLYKEHIVQLHGFTGSMVPTSNPYP